MANVVTFGTEGSKSAIQTAARGLGIDNDLAVYISSLIPADRGKIRTLKQCYYGDKENDFQPIPLFVQQMNEYPELWQTAQRIEGLICRIGEHAGGVIFVDEPFTNSTALMKVPNGDIVTQFDLHDAQEVSLIKIDLLSIEALDKIHTCIDLLIDQNYIEPEATLKETYFKYLDIYKLERNDPKMWKMVHNHEIQSLFQMEKQSGIQGIALTKPQSVDDLAVLNSVIRLMAQSKDDEQPLNKYARFKNNINLWYKEMDKHGLNPKEQELLKKVVGQSYGIAESQEKIMTLVQLPEIGGFSLTWADSLRKAVAKKNPDAYNELEKEFFANAEEKNLSINLCRYVWQTLIAMSRGYSFNLSHTLAYSLVALQEMNLALKFPIIFWNCACLITDSGGNETNDEDDEETKDNKTTDYAKIARAMGAMIQSGINIEPPNINTSRYTFYPDVENNKIIFGLSGILNVGEDMIYEIMEKRPYSSIKDFYQKLKPKRQSMVSLIKGGAFDEMEDRKFAMAWYIYETCDKKSNLTLQNMPGLMRYGLVPEDTEVRKMAKRIYEFNRYLKAICKKNSEYYQMDERAMTFLLEIGAEELVEDGGLLNIKVWDKNIYQKHMNVFREWLSQNKEEVLFTLNSLIFKDDWNKYALGNYSSWEMEALCFYYHEHELAKTNRFKYGFSDFNELPEEPILDRSFYKGDKEIKMFKLNRIYGTCIAKDKNKATATLLTPTGVVNVKFRKEYFSMFDKRISEIGFDGVKHTKEESWFNRGSMIVVCGMRRGNEFVAKKYASTGGHTLYKITEIDKDGDLTLIHERYKGGIEEDV